jgi:hypothetical protein
LAAAGCAISKGPAAAHESPTVASLPVVAHVPRLLASLHLRLPLDAYLPSLHEVERYGLANRELIHRCLLRFGVHVQTPPPVTGIGPRTWTERRYGLTDAKQAADLGYSLGDRDPSLHPGQTHGPRLNARALALLTGQGKIARDVPDLPAGGCSGLARRTLAGDEAIGDHIADPYLAQQLSQQSFESSRQDPRVQAVFKRWSQCMLADGHHYDDPLAPFSDSTLQHGPAAIAVHTAVDDVACKQATNLVGTWYAVESAYQNELIHDHYADLETLAAANTVTSRVIRKVLNSRNNASFPDYRALHTWRNGFW